MRDTHAIHPLIRLEGTLDLWACVAVVLLAKAAWMAAPKTPRTIGLTALHAANLATVAVLTWFLMAPPNPVDHIATHAPTLGAPAPVENMPFMAAWDPIITERAAHPLATPSPHTLILAASARPRTRPDELCAGLNIYHEARGESLRGQVMVTHVAINRTKAGYRGAKTLCDTIHSPAQFSWTMENPRQPDGNTLAKYRTIAKKAIAGVYVDRTHGSMHYYNPHTVDAWWSNAYVEVRHEGKHRFMR